MTGRYIRVIDTHHERWCVSIMKNEDGFLTAMKSQRFGVEIELTGISKANVRRILTEYFNDDELFDLQGREWNVKYDSSIYGFYRYNDSLLETSSNDYKVELVSPVLEYSDISMLQEIIRLIRKAGGVSSERYRCGIHVHVSDSGHNQNTLRNLIRLMSSKQYLLERAFNIPDSRLSQYCQYVSKDLEKRCKRSFKNMDALQKAWNNTSDRYSMLNLSSLFSDKGIELRLFNGSLHAGVIKAYIQFSLALCQSAKDLKRASSLIPRNNMNDKYGMRTWLCRMHLNGDEFKTCRKFMTKNLIGESAFADPATRKLIVDDDFNPDEVFKF